MNEETNRLINIENFIKQAMAKKGEFDLLPDGEEGESTRILFTDHNATLDQTMQNLKNLATTSQPDCAKEIEGLLDTQTTQLKNSTDGTMGDISRYKLGAIVKANNDIRGDFYICKGQMGVITERVGLKKALVEWPSGKMEVPLEDIDISHALS